MDKEINVVDLLALQDLALAYAEAVDMRDSAGVEAVFRPDGRLSIYPSGAEEPALVLTGSAELREIAGRLLDENGFGRTLHVMANHRVALDGDTASGTIYCQANLLAETEGKASNLAMYVKYVDEYVRVDGTWFISHRKALQQWSELRPVLTEQVEF